MMRAKFLIVAALSAAFLLAGCASSQEVTEPVPIDESWPCFNGCNIVLQAGKFGLVADDGTLILPSVYDSIEFLDNDVALLSMEGQYSLCTRTGRVLIRGESEKALRAGWPAILEETQEADRRSWEQVLQDYEQLCRRCKSSRGKRISRKEYAGLLAIRDKVMTSLQNAQGAPTTSQKARLEQLSADYRRAF